MKATIYLRPMCPFCIRAKSLLTEKNIDFEEIDITDKAELREEVSQSIGGWDTVPMIFLDEEFVGGCSELEDLDNQGKLDN